MPANSTVQIANNVDVDSYVASLTFGGTYTFSPQDSQVRFRNLPANVAGIGLKLVMPANPSDGDTYEWIDADGSCTAGHEVTVFPDPGGTATFAAVTIPSIAPPLPLFTWVTANSGAKFQFDAHHDQWLIFRIRPRSSAPG